jgi:hypothetical protein
VRQQAATPERLAEEIAGLLRDDATRVAMADASRASGRPNAAHDVAADLIALAGIPPRVRTGRTNGARVSSLPQEVR